MAEQTRITVLVDGTAAKPRVPSVRCLAVAFGKTRRAAYIDINDEHGGARLVLNDPVAVDALDMAIGQARDWLSTPEWDDALETEPDIRPLAHPAMRRTQEG